jgi:hypothetical protein
VALVRTDVSEASIASIIRVTRIGQLGTMSAVTSKKKKNAAKKYYVALIIVATRSSEMSVLTRGRRHNITEDGILHSHRRENFKFYIALTSWAL